MAFLPPKDDKQNQQGMNVLGGQAMQMQQQPEPQNNIQPMPTTGAAASSPTPSPNSVSPATGVQQQGSPQASAVNPQPQKQARGSGSFVNLRRYIQENRPATQRMTGAIGRNVGQQTQQIGQQVQKSQQEMAKRISEQRQNMAQEQQFGQNLIQQASQLDRVQPPAQPAQQPAGQPAGQAAPAAQQPTDAQPAQPQFQQISEEDLQRFRNFATDQTSFDEVQAIDLTGASAAQRDLAKRLQNVGRAPTRQRLLRDTFQNTGNYTAGQQRLDDLLLAKSGQQDLRNIAQQATQDVSGMLGDARSQALADMQQLTADEAQARQDLMSGVTGAKEDVRSGVDQRIADLQAERQAFQDALASGNVTQEQLERFIGDEQRQALQDEIARVQEEFGGYATGAGLGGALGGSWWNNLTSQVENQRKQIEDIRSNPQTYVEQLEQSAAAAAQRAESGSFGGSTWSQQERNRDQARRAAGIAAQRARQARELLESGDPNVGDKIAELAQQNMGSPRRYEWRGQLRNELGRLTSRMSNEELRLLGTTREALNQQIENEIIKYTGGPGDGVGYMDIGALYDFTQDLSQRAQGLNEQAIIDRITRGGTDLSAMQDLIAQEELTRANVGTGAESARMRALGQLAGLQQEDIDAMELAQAQDAFANRAGTFDLLRAATGLTDQGFDESVNEQTYGNRWRGAGTL